MCSRAVIDGVDRRSWPDLASCEFLAMINSAAATDKVHCDGEKVAI